MKKIIVIINILIALMAFEGHADLNQIKEFNKMYFNALANSGISKEGLQIVVNEFDKGIPTNNKIKELMKVRKKFHNQMVAIMGKEVFDEKEFRKAYADYNNTFKQDMEDYKAVSIKAYEQLNDADRTAVAKGMKSFYSQVYADLKGSSFGLEQFNEMYIATFEKLGGSKKGLEIIKKELANSIPSEKDFKKLNKQREFLYFKMADTVAIMNSFNGKSFASAAEDLGNTYAEEMKLYENAFVKAIATLDAKDRELAAKALQEIDNQMPNS